MIIGGGTAGWMAACALARALGRDVAIELVESQDIGTVGVGEATIPQIQLFNTFIDLDEAEFLIQTQASIKLGIEFVNWGRKGDRYIHAFGEAGHPVDLAGFHHLWLRAKSLGEAGDATGGITGSFWEHSLNAMAAKANRFGPGDGDPASPFSDMHYAYHFDAGLYAAYLRRLAEKRGVVRVEGKIVDVQRSPENGHVKGVTLDDGRALDAEFFIDCSGFRGLLIEETMKAGYDDWSSMLPCDRALAVPCQSVTPLTPYTRSTARKAGWQWRIPLQSRTGNGHVYCSTFTSDDEAARELLSNLDGRPLADPRPLRFVTGKRKKAWVGNVVALGLASGFLEPLESTSIHMIQSGISRLLAMFPDSAIDPTLARQYNSETVREIELIRDFIVLHYHVNQRKGEPFWDMCRSMVIPDTLLEKIELFSATARVARDPNDLFAETSWVQVMLGQNVAPPTWHPAANILDSAHLRTTLTKMQTHIAATVARMPSHSNWLEQRQLAKAVKPDFHQASQGS